MVAPYTTPLYGGVLWDVQDCLLADIDRRIEVISGPGGTLWGANAGKGVINIITKAAQDTQGLYALAAGGKQLQEQAGIATAPRSRLVSTFVLTANIRTVARKSRAAHGRA